METVALAVETAAWKELIQLCGILPEMVNEPVTRHLPFVKDEGSNDNGRSTLSEFLRTSPPTFTETTEPLDADDWIDTIEDLLALVNYNEDRQKVLYASHCLGGTSRAWWDRFKVMQGEHVIMWDEFKEGFHTAHIPSGMMAIKKQEFRALKQGSGSVKEYLQKFNLLSRHAPDDGNTEAAKLECFMEGLQQSQQYQLVVSYCRTFYDLVNKALMLEYKRRAMEDTRKRKLINIGGSSNHKAHPWQSATARPSYQPQLPSALAPRLSYQPQPYAKSKTSYNPPSNNNGGKTNNFGLVTCFGCGQPGHISKQCPNNKPVAPRPNSPNQGKGRGAPTRNQAPRNPS
ncbi:hypothetical protein D1007_14398 [Hordeum vulgare]|nr:hypothetical protein D1007_14398 [Hordeum vulgare]